MSRLMTIEEMIKRFGVNQKTLYNWRKVEGLPSVKVGKQIYFREEAVEEWLLARETAGQK